jgi:hypothetical protein
MGKIKKFDSIIWLEPIEHKYYHKVTNKRYKSVTTTLSSLEHEFDVEGVSLAIANQSDKVKQEVYIGMTQEQIKEYWVQLNNEANEYGTKVHNIVENYLLANKWYFPPDNEEGQFEQKVIDGYNKLKIDEGITMWPERILFSEQYELAGTSDLIIDIDDVFFDVADYKGLPLDTPIFTDSGWKTMGTLSLNDKVYDKNGDQTKIKAISDVKNKECYEITFDTGEKIVSDFEHRWLISFVREKKYKDIVMTTIELFDYMEKLPKGRKRHSWKIPKIVCARPLEISTANLPIDPYVFGVWLGDGNSADGKITNMDEKVWLEIEKRGYNIGKDVSNGCSGLATTRTIFGLGHELNKLGLLKNKHLPDIFLNCSFNQRLDVLRGLMDSDGYYNKTRKRFVMATTKKWQADAVNMLASSLGLKTTILKTYSSLNGKKIDAYNVCFTSYYLNPFLVRNQNLSILCGRNHYNTRRNIKSVKKVDSEPTICIEVESPTHTFLFGHSFIVTHNTNKVFNFFNPYGHETLKKPFDYMQASQWSIYTLQLSVYAYMYELEYPRRKCRQIYVLYWDKVLEEFRKIQIMYMKNEAKKLIEMHHYNVINGK